MQPSAPPAGDTPKSPETFLWSSPKFPEFPNMHPGGRDPDGVSAPLALIGGERINTEDRIFLCELLRRRHLSFPVDSTFFHGIICQQQNYTLAILGMAGLPKAIGIAKRNPAADAPDPGRGRRIALARALFDLLRAEGKSQTPEPESRNGLLLHAGNTLCWSAP